MKKTISIFILLYSIITGCNNNKSPVEHDNLAKVIKKKMVEADSLKKNVYPWYGKILEEQNWLKEFEKEILEENENFKIDSSKNISCFIVPNFEIPVSVLIKDNIDLMSYIPEGRFTVENADCFVLEDNTTIATFKLSENNSALVPGYFKDWIRKRNIEEARSSRFYFRLSIAGNYNMYFPALVFLDEENNFKFIDYNDNGVYPINEIYRVLFDSKEKLQTFLNEVIKEHEN